MLCFKVNSVNCNTSWKISLFLAYEDNSEEVLKGVGLFSVRMNTYYVKEIICWWINQELATLSLILFPVRFSWLNVWELFQIIVVGPKELINLSTLLEQQTWMWTKLISLLFMAVVELSSLSSV